jgi:hypothetical protein
VLSADVALSVSFRSHGCLQVALCVLHLSAHGRDGDDAGAEARQRALGLDGSLQKRQESDGGEIDTCDVCVVRVVPVLHALVLPELLLQVTGVVVLGLGLWTGDSSSGDEQVDVLLLGLEVLDESFEVVLLGDISWADWDDATAMVRVVGLCRLFERFSTAASDVDLWAPLVSQASEGKCGILLTLAPLAARACEHIKPMPVPPPVTTQTYPDTSNSLEASKWCVAAILIACLISEVEVNYR